MPQSDSIFLPSVSSKPYGVLPDGKQIDLWTLQGAEDFRVEFITLGGTVTKVMVPDKNGDVEDVVLGFDDLESYLENKPYFGVIVGRVAGRITGAKFELEGREYRLDKNDPPNHLHGGSNGLDKQVWTPEIIARDDGMPSVRLSYFSPHGESGYPGNVELSVTYTLTKNYEFIFETEATSDRRTPISLTHHSYFNLAGAGNGNILNHEVQIFADKIFSNDENMGLIDQLGSVKKTASDFTNPKKVGSVINEIYQQHGDLYWLGLGQKFKEVACVREKVSGRSLSVLTDNSCLQTYFGAGFSERIQGKLGKRYEKYAGMCFECEGYPNAMNTDKFGDIRVSPENPQRLKTIYKFN